jgi:hypothetical protein
MLTVGLMLKFVSARRKAYRLGKWLANVNAIRKMPLSTRYSYLEWLANGGEGAYYFVEQLTWYLSTTCTTHAPCLNHVRGGLA